MKSRTISVALAALMLAGAAQAETLTYVWSLQPVWGGNAYDVDARLDLDDLYGPQSLNLTVDFGAVTHSFDATPHLANGGTDFQIFTFGADFQESFGPLVTWHGVADEQYRASLDLDFVFYKNPKTVDITGRILLQEFVETATTEYCYNPYGLTAAGSVSGGTSYNVSTCGVPQYSGGYSQYNPQLNFAASGTPASVETVPTSTVPLPASGLLLLGAFGAAGALRLRRRKG